MKHVHYLKSLLGIENSSPETVDEQDFQLLSTGKHDGLRSFPKPIAKILDRYISSILRDFVESWYVYLGPDEKDFIEEARIALEHITVALNNSLSKASIPNATVNLIHVFQRHIKTFDECQTIIQTKYPNLPEKDFALLISELYQEAAVPHTATLSKGNELDYLKSLVDILLHKFLPTETFSCLSGRFLLREILAIQCLEPLVKKITDAHFVNEIVIDILEPSVPLSIILKQWELAMKEIEHEEDEKDQVNIVSAGENTSPETAYESTREQDLKISPKKISKIRKNRKPRVRSKSKKKLFSLPDDSSAEDTDNNKDDAKEWIRFDKLDTKTSYPVYGSTSARDHERSRDKLILQLQNSNGDELEPIDSGRASFGREPSPQNSDNEVICGSPPAKRSEWAMCPPSRADVFRHPSFYGMPLKQDDFKEQIKAKVHAADLTNIISLMPSMTCIEPCLRKSQTKSITSMDIPTNGDLTRNFENSVDGSVTMNFQRKQQQVPFTLVKEKSTKDEEVKKSTDESSEIVRVHKCGEDGAFYEIAPSCPTCIEMTSLASPYQNEKAQIVLSEKEIKEREKKDRGRKSYEHECGLDTEHFCNAEAETESITIDPMIPDDDSYVSCSDLLRNNLSDNSVSSGTLLASAETFGESEQLSDEGTQTSSFDNISDVSLASRSDLSPDMSIDYEMIPGSWKRARRRKLSHAASVQTFKTAIEDESLFDENARHKSLSSNSLDGLNRTKTFDKKFIHFFRKGIQKLPSRKKKSKSTSQNKDQEHVKNSKTMKGKRRSMLYGNHVRDDELKIESSSISTSPTKFNSLPEYSSSIHTAWKDPKDLVEEEGLEIGEDDDVIFDGMMSQRPYLPPTVVDPLSKEIAVTDMKDLPNDIRSVKSLEIKTSNSPLLGTAGTGNEVVHDPTSIIPIFEGEVIMPHPSKLPAAWLYPIQMISIPSTEVAYENRWEPGINKYTLYIIHYDIRIWPDLYQKQLLEANTKNEEEDSVPLIREIKRRYKEFLLIHNRLSYGALSKHMKGILRPNRRYAMPFGRMDPDVIEGRRKILETYLVSLVSRPELCNSREFKDFLGFEDTDEVAVLKPKKVEQKKQVYKSQAKSIVPEVKETHALQVGPKDTADKLGMKSPYFIHGYDVPRMFGYAEEDHVSKHSKLVLSHFVLNYQRFKNVKQNKKHTEVETLQEPDFYFSTHHPSPAVSSHENSGRASPIHPLGPRTAGDGAEAPVVHNDENTSAEKEKIHKVFGESKKFKGTINPSIAAKFSEELAAKLREERKHLASKIAHEKSLYESSWPITDAVLSIASQILKGYRSWLTYEKVQQAILFSLGGLIEWLVNRELEEVIMKERCYKYLKDLYNVLWDEHDCLRPSKPDVSHKEKQITRDKCLEKVTEFIPAFVRLSIGSTAYRKCCTKLVKSLQYERINKHLLYAALEVILSELVSECAEGYPRYIDQTKHS